jgi:hypothetical protein
VRNHAYHGQKVTGGPLEQQKPPHASSLTNVSLDTRISSDIVPMGEDEEWKSSDSSQKHSPGDDGVSVDVDIDKDEDFTDAND